MSLFQRLFRQKDVISQPQSVVRAVHVDADLNWTFDPSIDPKSQFTKLKVIGKGGFGTVLQIAHRPSMKTLAGKLINANLVTDSTRAELEHEIELMRSVKSPLTVRYFGSVHYDGSLMILMEYCDRGSLRDILDVREQVLSEDQISVIMCDLLKGLKLLHTQHRIVHRDIKAANILLTSDMVVKIADFGVSRRFDSGGNCQTMTIVGTPYWMAPEVISGVSYSFPADLWSVGITAVELAEGAPPYVEMAPSKAMVEIAMKGFPGYRFRELHSDEFCDFVSHCVNTDPNDRWSIDQLLAHPFIQRASRLPREQILAELVVPANQQITGTDTMDYATLTGALTFSDAENNQVSGLSSAHMISDSDGDFVNLPSARSFVGSSADCDSFDGTAAFMLQGGDSSVYLPSPTPIRQSDCDSSNSSFSSFNMPVMQSLEGSDDTSFDIPTFSLPSGSPRKTSVRVSTGKKQMLPIKSKDLPDLVYVKTARAMSIKIPFVPLKVATMPDTDTTTLYKPYVSEIPSLADVPMFDDEGVLNLQAALRNKKSPPMLATILIVVVFFFFGKDGFLALATLAFLTNLIVSHLREARKKRKEAMESKQSKC